MWFPMKAVKLLAKGLKDAVLKPSKASFRSKNCRILVNKKQDEQKTYTPQVICVDLHINKITFTKYRFLKPYFYGILYSEMVYTL